MADDKQFDLSRRKVLGSIGTIGVASAAAGAGTMAWFKDPENSTENTIQAGQMDLQIGYDMVYNGGPNSSDPAYVSPTDDPGIIFSLQDVKPGDSAKACIDLSVDHNPAWVFMAGELVANNENTKYEMEGEAGDSTTGQDHGELAQNIEVRVWEEEDGDCTYDNSNSNNPADHELARGTLMNVFDSSKLGSGVRLDGNLSQDSKQAVSTSSNQHIGFEWWVPEDVGSEIQSDKVEFKLKFKAIQERHNSNPDNPYN